MAYGSVGNPKETQLSKLVWQNTNIYSVKLVVSVLYIFHDHVDGMGHGNK